MYQNDGDDNMGENFSAQGIENQGEIVGTDVNKLVSR